MKMAAKLCAVKRTIVLRKGQLGINRALNYDFSLSLICIIKDIFHFHRMFIIQHTEPSESFF